MTTLRDIFCRLFHHQRWPHQKDGRSYQQCLGRKPENPSCGRELLSKLQVEGRTPFQPHTEREMTAIEKHFEAEARRNALHLNQDLDELERIGKL